VNGTKYFDLQIGYVAEAFTILYFQVICNFYLFKSFICCGRKSVLFFL
jgi:hypothetical protein